jgi:hypothetical protein
MDSSQILYRRWPTYKSIFIAVFHWFKRAQKNAPKKVLVFKGSQPSENGAIANHVPATVY